MQALVKSASSHPISKSMRQEYGKEIDHTRVSDIQEISEKGIQASVDGISVAIENDKLMNSFGIIPGECQQLGTILHIALDGDYADHIVISDVLKPNAEAAVKALKSVGIGKMVMLTGDAKAVGSQTASNLGIDEVHSELLPDHKVSKVEELLQEKKGHGKLVFVGDGINDAPVLSRADIGIAMGSMDSDAAIEAADVGFMVLAVLNAIRALFVKRL